MMSGAKSLTLFMLCLLAGVNGEAHGASSPTTAPTAAPTSSPTSATETTDDSTTTAKPADGNTTDGNGTTEAPVATIKKTTFKTELGVPKAEDFDEAAFTKSVAAAAGVDATEVKVLSTDFIVKVSYKFADDTITADDCTKGAAQMAGVEASAVTCTIAEGRRLQQGNLGRRLAKTAAVEIKAADAAAADALTTTAANATAITEGIKAAVNKTFAAPEVASAPAVKVVVQTEISSTKDVSAAVSADAFTTELVKKLKEETNKDFTADVSDVAMKEEEVTTTTAVQTQETSSARKQAVSVLLSLACLAFFAN